MACGEWPWSFCIPTVVNDAKGEHLTPIMSRSDSLLEKTVLEAASCTRRL